mgnify:CR=1 FL=1
MAASYKLLKTYEFLNRAELDLIKLEDEGINVRMSDNNTVSVAPHLGPAVGGIKLFVPEDELEQAQSIISNSKADEKYLDELFEGEGIEPAIRCPKCQSPNVFQERSFLAGLLFLLAFVLPVSIPQDRYHCSNCDNTWQPAE